MTLPPDPRIPDDDDAPEAESELPEGDVDEDGGDDDAVEDELPAGDEAEPEGGEAETREDVEPRRGQTPNDRIRAAKAAQKEADRRAAETDARATEALRRAEAAERRAEEAERRSTERQRQETAEQEAARLELMSSDEKLEHYRKKDREEHQKEMSGVRFEVWNGNDRSDFRQLCRDNPSVAKVKDEVEKKFEELKAQGRTVSREIIAKLELGDRVLKGYDKAVAGQRARGSESVRRETVKAPKTRSDVAPQRARRGEEDSREARRKRLADVQL